MNKQDIQVFYKYNQWANRKILEAAADVTAGQYLAPASFPHGGLRGTLVHALSAEWIWRSRWEGTSPTASLRPEEFASLDSLRSRWEAEEDLLMTFVDGVTNDRLNGYFQYTSTNGTPYQRILWQTMVHLVNHGTQHRSEAAAILTDLGRSPGDIDMIYFLGSL